MLIAIACAVAVAGCGGSDGTVENSATDTRDAEPTLERDDSSPVEDIALEDVDDDVLLTPSGEPRLTPTADGPKMRFGVIPTEWYAPSELGQRDAAVGLPDETGAFLFMVSLRKARFVGDFEHLRAITAEVGMAVDGMRPGMFSHRTTRAFGLTNCELMSGTIVVTEDDGRFPVGHQMRSRTWACLHDGMLYQAMALEMAEPDEVIATDIRTLVNRVEIDPHPLGDT